MSYAEIKIKNHKKHNKKIMFVIFEDCDVTDGAKLDKLIDEYHTIIRENKGISIIADARGIKSFSKTLAFSKAGILAKHDDLIRANVSSTAILLDSPILKLLLDSVMKVYTPVVPTKVAKDNSDAMEYVISHFK